MKNNKYFPEIILIFITITISVTLILMIKFDSPEYNVTYPTERFETVVSYVYDENKIDINNASAEELTALFNVGEKRAELIIAHRKKIGGFYYIEELLDVEKLPDSVYYNNKDIITINEYTEAFE